MTRPLTREQWRRKIMAALGGRRWDPPEIDEPRRETRRVAKRPEDRSKIPPSKTSRRRR